MTVPQKFAMILENKVDNSKSDKVSKIVRGSCRACLGGPHHSKMPKDV
jgi:hypothetical protein